MRPEDSTAQKIWWTFLTYFSGIMVLISCALCLTVVGMVIGIPLMLIFGTILDICSARAKGEYMPKGPLEAFSSSIDNHGADRRRNLPVHDTDDTRNGDLGYRGPYRG